MTDQIPEEAIEDIIAAVLLDEVGDRLRWNEAAYGKAWNGEDGDTEFVLGNSPKLIVERLRECGYEFQTGGLVVF